MAVFSPQPLKKWFFFFLIRQIDPSPPPPPRKSQNAQFLQWIRKDDDVYFQKLQHLKFGGIFS